MSLVKRLTSKIKRTIFPDRPEKRERIMEIPKTRLGQEILYRPLINCSRESYNNRISNYNIREGLR